MQLTKYNKTIAALVITIIGWASSVVTSNSSHITAGEWVQLASAIAATAGVYAIANKTEDK